MPVMLLIIFLLHCDSCSASFHIYLEDALTPPSQITQPTAFTCELTIGYKGDARCKISHTYSPKMDTTRPIIELAETPETIAVLLHFPLDGEQIVVDNIIGFEKIEDGWRTQSFVVHTVSNKSDFQLYEELVSTTPPKLLKLIIKGPQHECLTDLKPGPPANSLVRYQRNQVSSSRIQPQKSHPYDSHEGLNEAMG